MESKRENEGTGIQRSGKAVSVKYTDYTGECNLPDNREGLDCKNNKDWSVSRLHDAESTHFCQMAGYEISK